MTRQLSTALKTKINLARPTLAKASDAFWQDARLAQLFPEFQFQLYSAMRASVSLIEAARDAAAAMAAEDPLADAVVEFYAEHAEEEREHANWLLDDMEAIGAVRADVKCRTPHTSVAALVGVQYYWVYHVHPAMLMGYLAVLEGDPMSAERIQAYAADAGIPAAGLRTLIYHAKEDRAHSEELYGQIDRLPLKKAQEEKLGYNALQVMGQLAAVFDAVVKKPV